MPSHKTLNYVTPLFTHKCSSYKTKSNCITPLSINHLSSNMRKRLPVLVTPCPHVLHSSKATGNSSEAVQILQNGPPRFQIIWIFSGL